jgi:Domain of unknown function (DUF6930)
MDEEHQHAKRKRGERTRQPETNPVHFFEAELKGEEALTRSTAEAMYQATAEFMLLRPWDFLADEELILMDDSECGERCYCCVMGGAGEWFGMHVYQGDESYRLYRRIVRGNKLDPYSFYERQRGVSVELVGLRELELPDRKMLQAFKHPLKKGLFAPKFRALRPGYLPWFVTDQEGRLLVRCLRTVNTFCQTTTVNELDKFWQKKDTYPLVRADGQGRHIDLSLTRVAEPAPSLPEIPDLNGETIQRIKEKCEKSEVSLDTAHFFAPGTIGGKHDRKACLHLALVSDTNSGFLYASEVGLPGEMQGSVVSRALMGAMESGAFVPKELRVMDHALATSLAGLGAALEIQITTAKLLPAIESAKKGLFRTLLNRDLPRL